MVTNICALPVGSILDKYGPRLTGIMGSFILMLAALSLKFAAKYAESWFDGYLMGYSLLALGSPFVFISCFQLANSFPKNSGLILALLTGAFDASSSLFLGYRVFYFNHKKVSLSTFFSWYLIAPAFILLCQVFIMPHSSYKTVETLAKIAETAIDETGKPLDDDLLLPEDTRSDNSEEVTPYIGQHSETSALLSEFRDGRRVSVASARSSTKSVYEQQAEERLVHKSGGVFGILHGYTAKEQMKTTWFVLMTVYTAIQMLRINYFVATIKAQEAYLYGDEDTAIAINHVFDIALPLGGIIAIPFIGLILDNLTTLTVLTILTSVSVFVGAMGLLSWLPGTYAGVLIFVVYRPFYYTAVSDFCAKVFGFETFGTVYGSIIAFSGFCNILQQPLDKLTKSYLQGNPFIVNASLTGITLVLGIAIVLFVKSQELQILRKNLELEADLAENLDIPT